MATFDDVKKFIPFMQGDGYSAAYDDQKMIKIAEAVVEGEKYDVVFSHEGTDAMYVLLPQKTVAGEAEDIYELTAAELLEQDAAGNMIWASSGVKFSFIKNLISTDGILDTSKKQKQSVYGSIAVLLAGMISIFLAFQTSLGIALGILLAAIGGAILYFYRGWERVNQTKIQDLSVDYRKFVAEYLKRYFKYAYVFIGVGGVLFVVSVVMKIIGW